METGCVPVTAAGVCANCGQEDGGGAKLKNCNACLLVKYCGVDCQKAHRKQHKKACKQRAAELKDERLYGQGHERPEEDFCPICTLPVPIPTGNYSSLNACCMKMVCNGCMLAAIKRGIHSELVDNRRGGMDAPGTNILFAESNKFARRTCICGDPKCKVLSICFASLNDVRGKFWALPGPCLL